MTNDAVVFLETISGKKVRHVYVGFGESFTMTSIPGGEYVVKVLQGMKWNPEKDNGTDAPRGGFMEDVSISSSSYLDPFDYPYPKSGHYMEYTITLQTVEGGNMSTRQIFADELY